MKHKSLIETNPYIKDPDKRRKLLYTTVQSSTAVEGVYFTAAKAIETLDKEDTLFIVCDGEESSEEQQ